MELWSLELWLGTDWAYLVLEPTCLRPGSARRVVYGSGVRAPSSESLEASFSMASEEEGEKGNSYILTFRVILIDRELANVKGSMTDLAILRWWGSRCRCSEEEEGEGEVAVLRGIPQQWVDVTFGGQSRAPLPRRPSHPDTFQHRRLPPSEASPPLP